MLVGLGGVRLIRDGAAALALRWHMNEGHCAFLTLERMKNLMEGGLNFQEAREAIRASSCFTTHTPVPAGNETFDLEILGHYLRDYITGEMKISWEQFLELRRGPGGFGKWSFQ